MKTKIQAWNRHNEINVFLSFFDPTISLPNNTVFYAETAFNVSNLYYSRETTSIWEKQTRRKGQQQ